MTYLDVPAKWVFVEREKATGTYDEPNCYDCSQAFNSDQEVVRFRLVIPGAEQQDPHTYLMHDHCWGWRLEYEADREKLRNPQVEIAAYRHDDDPGGTMDLQVFVNGVLHGNVRIGIVDPAAGAPHKLSEWRENTFDMVRMEGSEAWTEQMTRFYEQAEEKYVEDDTVPGDDPQPGVTVMDEMNPDLWLGDGTLRRNDRSLHDHEHDNTLRAGWALIAVKATHQAMPQGPLAMATAALAAHVRVTHGEMMGHGENVQDLITDLWHLVGARRLQPEWVLSEPETTIQALVVALRDAVDGAWSVLVEDDQDWDSIETTAFHRYLEELRGV